MSVRNYFWIVLSVFVASCNRPASQLIPDKMTDQSGFELTEDYIQEIEDWQTKRFENITSTHGWLSVVGLYWLDQGENKLGSSAKNSIVIPDAASHIGSIFLDGDALEFKSYPEAHVTSGNQTLRKGPILSDADGQATFFDNQTFNFHVIKRGTKYGLRVKNTIAQARFELKDIPEYDINPGMIFKGVVATTEVSDSILITDIVGTQKMYKIEAMLQFEAQGQTQGLLAINGGKDNYFVVFKDETTGEETYGGGRFLYVRRPSEGSKEIILDFNKAHNPPCAFTDYATCPLPPLENTLDFLVNAGEKRLKTH